MEMRQAQPNSSAVLPGVGQGNHQGLKENSPLTSQPSTNNSSSNSGHMNTAVSPGGPTRNHQGLPMSPPQQQSPDPVHDLPMELLQVGWRRFWSRREGRPYYFNKITNQSLWEMPPLPDGHVGFERNII